MTNKAEISPIRTLGFASISASYAKVGTTFEAPARIICITNNTQGDMLFSRDGVTDELFVSSGGFKLFDITTNHRPVNQDDFCFVIGTQWYVKQITAPTSGAVYIEMIYAQ